MLRSTRVRLAVVTAAASLSLGVAAGPAAAAPQAGLVNVDISNNTVQVPIAVAANICDINVAALSALIGQSAGGTCGATTTSTADDAFVSPGSGGGPQAGLVNISVTDNLIQVPIGLAVNLCNVNAAVLAVLVAQSATGSCTATSTSTAGGRRN